MLFRSDKHDQPVTTTDTSQAAASQAPAISQDDRQQQEPDAEPNFSFHPDLVLTCICCPKGCRMGVCKTEDGLKVEGNACKRGEDHAIEEFISPKRTLTTIVECENREQPLSVRTAKPIPRSAISACLEKLDAITVHAPVRIGDVIVADICDTGSDVVATESLA